jgi:hypothetical protein
LVGLHSLSYYKVPLPSQGFHSEGAGKGSTFFVDLPIYFCKEPIITHHPHLDIPAPIVEQVDMGGQFYTMTNNVSGIEQWGSISIAHHSSHPTPFSSILIEDYPIRRKFLIVDDSSMNRYTTMNGPDHAEGSEVCRT